MGAVLSLVSTALKMSGLGSCLICKTCCKCLPTFPPRGKDLTIFEFSLPKVYLAWRATCMVLTSLLLLFLPSPAPLYTRPRPPALVYMHGWLAVALVAGMGLETAVLVYVRLCFSDWQLEKPKLPISLRLVWYQYMVVYPNIFSCAFMYAFCFPSFDFDNPFHFWLQVVLTLSAVVHVMTTATPSHLMHIVGPVAFTFVYLAFALMWQVVPYMAYMLTPTDPATQVSAPTSAPTSAPHNATGGQAMSGFLPDVAQSILDEASKPVKPLYPDMDWNYRASMFGYFLLWPGMTALCHTLMMAMAYLRKSLFSHLRQDPWSRRTKYYSNIGKTHNYEAGQLAEAVGDTKHQSQYVQAPRDYHNQQSQAVEWAHKHKPELSWDPNLRPKKDPWSRKNKNFDISKTYSHGAGQLADTMSQNQYAQAPKDYQHLQSQAGEWAHKHKPELSWDPKLRPY